ncbi:MAG: protein kinase [Planctomycetia bacterium]|nr:protein kinase [Planctomycetia bacterium]
MGSSARIPPEQPPVPEPPAGSLADSTELHVPDSRTFWPEQLGESVADATVISKPGRSTEENAGNPAVGGTVVPAPSHELSKLLAGERLGHYELIEFAGGGGMGAVFRGRDCTLNREVAIKVLSRTQACDDETLKRFKNEAQSAARLDHENIARVYYVGEDRGLHFIVFEFIEGVNVRQLVEKVGRIPLDDAVSYTLQVADALSHASAREIVHRDIKPSNIIITAQGRAKLVDMGLARLHGIQPGAEDLTASGVTLGTFDYISPEQARDPRGADVRSDIYSLGCTLYYMLTGRPPFPEGTVLQKLLQHNSDDPIDPREFNPTLPEAVTTILRKMLAKDPLRRYQTPADLIADLLHLAERIGIRRNEVRLATKWESGPQAATAWQRHLPWIVPIAALAAIIVGLEFYDRARDDDWNSLRLDPRMAQAPGTPEENRKPAGNDNGPPTAIPDPGAAPATPVPTGSGAASAVAVQPVPTGTAAANTTPANGSTPLTLPTTLTKIDLSTPFVKSTTPVVPMIDPTVAPAGVTPAVATLPTPPADPAAVAPVGPRKLPAPRDGVLVVCDAPDDSGRYMSLRAACFAAKNGDVVELCYDGERVERPLVLNNLKLTVRAGEGYRPRIRFRPAEAAIPNLPHMMATIVGGRLTMVGIEIGFDVPSPQDFPADHWSLFELQHAEYLGLERCVLTINNASADGRAYHPNVALLGTSLPPGAPSSMNMPMTTEGATPAPTVEPVEVWLEHCVVRGEASLLRAAELQPISLHWNDGLLSVSESAVVVTGGAILPKDVDVRIDLNHLTAVTAAPFAQISDNFDAPHLPSIAITCSDSILYSLTGAPLVDYDGIDVRNDFLKTFQWTGERVFYEGFKPEGFWRLASGDDVAQMLTFDDWRAQWGPQRELQTVWREVRWKRPIPLSPIFHSMHPDDFALDDAGAAQRAVRGAADGNDVGMVRALLPLFSSLSKTDGDLRTQSVGSRTP